MQLDQDSDDMESREPGYITKLNQLVQSRSKESFKHNDIFDRRVDILQEDGVNEDIFASATRLTDVIAP